MTTATRPSATPSGGTSRVARRFARWFPGERIAAVDRVGAMAARFDRLPHQRPATCGAYVLSYLLPALGFARHDGHDLAAEDYIAHLAAVVVEAAEVAPSDDVARRVAAGELTEREALERYGRVWYRYPVRASADPVESGTSPTGVARAVALGSRGRLTSLPLASRLADGTVQLTPERWERLLDLLAAHVAEWRWHAVFNYQSDQLLRPDDPSFTPANLRAPDVETRIPRDDWGVGHFVGLAGLWRMSWTGPWWLLLFDTYKERGFAGYQPQPAELMRLGLVREDGRGGGLLLILPRTALEGAAAAVAGLGLVARTWSNGSTEPDDWTWEMGR
ncbi:MAG: hypothetical protein A2X23_05950 [Chloroflexi bacterium GWC2_73_18]|nr:MAG: hypothetical protein A2X23_05950 [Chloroflexi bacterium GWC2_73_18]